MSETDWENCFYHPGCKVVHMDGPMQSAWRTLDQFGRLQSALAAAQEEIKALKADLLVKETWIKDVEDHEKIVYEKVERYRATLERIANFPLEDENIYSRIIPDRLKELAQQALRDGEGEKEKQ